MSRPGVAAASLVLSLCHERAFLDHFFGKTGKRTSITNEIGFIAASITPAGGIGKGTPTTDPGRELLMFADHKVATAIGAVGVAIVLGHVVLGPNVVPPALGLLGAALAAAAGLYIWLARRRGGGRSEDSSERG